MKMFNLVKMIEYNNLMKFQVTEDMVSVVVVQFLFLQFQNFKEFIYMYINFSGGIVIQGLGIYDIMQYIFLSVVIWCLGQVCSMGAFFLVVGVLGMRKVLFNFIIMVYQLLGGVGVNRCGVGESFFYFWGICC